MSITENEKQKRIEILRGFRREPERMIKTYLNVDLWEKQIEIIHAVRDNKKVVVRSANGVGKTFTAATLALQFLYSYKPSLVITTAPTWSSVKSILWHKINELYSKSIIPLGGEIADTTLKLEKDRFAMGLSTTEAEKFQGRHEQNILFIFDEAPGIKPIIFSATEGSMTSTNARWLMIGNPLSPSGYFYDAFTNPQWKGMHISAFDCPNVREKKEIIAGLTTWEWVQERLEEWGEDSPLYQSRVLGNFPSEGADTLFPLTVIENSVDIPVYNGEASLGIDVARGGTDESVFTIKKGGKVVHIEAVHQWDTMAVVGKAVNLIKEWNVKVTGVDIIGIGSGVFDRLREMNYNVIAVNVAEASSSPDEYLNLRAEIFVEMSKDFKRGDISIPRNLKLIGQLTGIKYKFASRGCWQIEGKEDMKKRGLKSPDYADSLAIANYVGKMLQRSQNIEKFVIVGNQTEASRFINERF